MEQAGPRAFIRRPCNYRIKSFADPGFQKHRCSRFFDLPFDFFRSILLFCAVLCERLQLIIPIGH